MNVSIIFHSVNGNTYLMAKAFKESFAKKNVNVNILFTSRGVCRNTFLAGGCREIPRCKAQKKVNDESYLSYFAVFDFLSGTKQMGVCRQPPKNLGAGRGVL